MSPAGGYYDEMDHSQLLDEASERMVSGTVDPNVPVGSVLDAIRTEVVTPPTSDVARTHVLAAAN